MMGIQDEYVAYCFDEAIGMFGSWIDSKLGEVQGKTVKERQGNGELLLRSLLSDSPAAGYAEPIATM